MSKRAFEEAPATEVIEIDGDEEAVDLSVAFDGVLAKLPTSVLSPVILKVMDACAACHADVVGRMGKNEEVSDVYLLPRAANCGVCWREIGKKLGAIYVHIAAAAAGTSVEKMLQAAAAPADTPAAAGAGAVEELA